jgi:uncharacterized membrane protein YgdD (TMEM256/DUF423 family)
MRRWAFVLIAIAAASGAGGVIEAAVAAHGTADPLLQTSANFLLLSGAAVIAIAACSSAARHRMAWFLAAGSILIAGAVLFCGDLTARVFLQHKLFAFATPAGGSLMILGWFAAALAALSALGQSNE